MISKTLKIKRLTRRVQRVSIKPMLPKISFRMDIFSLTDDASGGGIGAVRRIEHSCKLVVSGM
jgi:hypothetical protein